MKTSYNPLHAQHQARLKMFHRELVPCFEVPARVDHVLAELQRRPLGYIARGKGACQGGHDALRRVTQVRRVIQRQAARLEQFDNLGQVLVSALS